MRAQAPTAEAQTGPAVTGPAQADPADRRRPAALGSRLSLLAAVVAPLWLVAGCDPAPDRRPVTVDVVGTGADLARPLDAARRPSGQAMLTATAQGLLAFDSRGEVLPALAESWIVADEGRSVIFRLRRTAWPDGSAVKAPEVATLLRARMRASPRLLAGLSPEVRAMTDRVIEIRLAAPLPTFLQLLAHPAMAIQRGRAPGGTGPYGPARQGSVWLLTPLPDQQGEAAERANGDDAGGHRRLRAVPAPLGVARFTARRSDLLLGGRFQDLPLIAAGRVRGEAVRADPVQGLFGLAVEARSGPLADQAVRRAVAAAIDREGLARGLGLAGWTVSTTILPAALDLGRAPGPPEWASRPLETRRAEARRAVLRWQEANGAPPALRVALPAGSGSRLLFFHLAADLRRIGLPLRMVGWEAPAELRLIDEVPPFDSALWYLARIDCANAVSCDAAASTLLNDARRATTQQDMAFALARAELLMTAHGGYIALGLPIRWSLVSPRLTGFAASPRGRHPLNRLVADPN